MLTPYGLIIGVDEAGRGALAGPVVVCAASILDNSVLAELDLRDSKAMTPKARQASYDKIALAVKAGKVKLAVSTSTNEVVDEVNILEATKAAAGNAAWGVLYVEPGEFDERFSNATFMVDGNYNLLIDEGIPLENAIVTVVKGDTLVDEIKLASIVAKVFRDKLMTQASTSFPGYGFERNFGYGSPEHIKAIEHKKPCQMHRLTFKRVKEHVKGNKDGRN